MDPNTDKPQNNINKPVESKIIIKRRSPLLYLILLGVVAVNLAFLHIIYTTILKPANETFNEQDQVAQVTPTPTTQPRLSNINTKNEDALSTTHYKVTINQKPGQNKNELPAVDNTRPFLINYLKDQLGGQIYRVVNKRDRNSDFTQKYSGVFYIQTRGDSTIPTFVENDYALISVEPVEKSLEPYLNDPDYCEQDTDCLNTAHFCSLGAFNEYHEFYDAWGCGAPADKETGDSVEYDEVNECYKSDIHFEEIKCIKNTCTGINKTATCRAPVTE